MPLAAMPIVSSRPSVPSGCTSPKPMVVMVMKVMNNASSQVPPRSCHSDQ